MCQQQQQQQQGKKISKRVLVGQFGRGKGGEEKETYLRSLMSLKNCTVGGPQKKRRGG
jgi:hypothetical protein